MFSTAGVSRGSQTQRPYPSLVPPMTYSRLRTSAGRKSRMPRAGWVLAEDIELALVYFAGNHNLKSERGSSPTGREQVIRRLRRLRRTSHEEAQEAQKGFAEFVCAFCAFLRLFPLSAFFYL